MININERTENDLRESANFIKQALSESASYIEVDSDENEDEPIQINKEINESNFFPLKPGKFNNALAAIDGGSCNIVHARSFCVGMQRCGYTIYKEGKPIEETIAEPDVITVSLGTTKDIFLPVYLNLLQESPDETPPFGQIVGRIRSLKEWELTESLVNNLEPGSIVLVDGSLRASVSLPYKLIQRICKKAADNGVHLAGITKTSTLYWGKHSPLIPIIKRMGDRAYPDEAWYCCLSDIKKEISDSRWFGTIYVAKLSPASDYAFRIDINRDDQEPPEKILANIAAFCQDPVYMGYPYPLAAIHNRVRIAESEIEDFYYRLQSIALEEGIKMEDWNTLFSDFHELLDVNE